MLPLITPSSFDSLVEPIPQVNSTVLKVLYRYCTPTRCLTHNMDHTNTKREERLATPSGFLHACKKAKMEVLLAGVPASNGAYAASFGPQGMIACSAISSWLAALPRLALNA